MAALRNLGWFVLNILQALFLISWSVLWMGVGAIAGGVFGRRAFGLSLARTAWSPGVVGAAGGKLDIRGLDKIDWSKPHVIVVNHQSMIDIAVLQLGLPANLRFIAKAELLKIPVMGSYMKGVGMIPIDRGNGAEAVARLQRVADQVVHDSACVIAFAEGTRSRTGVIQPFKKGAFMLAISAQIPVVPVSIEGARKVLPPDGFHVRPGIIRIDIGDPIPTRGLSAGDRDDLIARAHRAVVDLNVGAGGLGQGSVAIELDGRERTGVLRPVSRP